MAYPALGFYKSINSIGLSPTEKKILKARLACGALVGGNMAPPPDEMKVRKTLEAFERAYS